MNRLQKKCFIASAGFHLLLVVILFIGPAFLSSKSNSDDLPVIDYIPAKLIDAAFSNVGTPNAKPPHPAAAAPVARSNPQPPTPKPPEPDPPKQVNKPSTIDPESLEASHEPKKPRIQINTTPVVRKSNSQPTSKQPPAVDTRERQLADARRRASELLGKAARSLSEDLSSSTSIEMPNGNSHGEAYASYAQVVKSIYEHAWLVPDDTASDDAITKATVTISNDGTVVSARIVGPSGDSVVDKSVQRTLDRVTFIAPFPDGAKEKQRTYTINFNLKAKRLLG